MAHCLVLGANGFIGSHLVDALVAQGHTVRAFDRFGGEGHERYLPDGLVEKFQGDFMNMGDIERALEGMEYVFHFVSTTTPATAENAPLIDVETNIHASIELFELCTAKGIKRVVYASTGGAIYGESTQELRSEDDTPLPVSPYAIGKLTIEHYLRYFKVKHGLDSISLRISNPYGERQPMHRKQGVIPIFLENVLAGKQLTVFGDGTMVRDYLYVRDLASMIAGMFEKPAKYPVYNVGSGKGFTVNQLIGAIEEVSGQKASLVHESVPATFVQRVVLDTSRFAEEFNLKPQTSLADGLKATYRYIQSEVRSEHA
jgi:UDP-glucose 4-epimerase